MYGVSEKNTTGTFSSTIRPRQGFLKLHNLWLLRKRVWLIGGTSSDGPARSHSPMMGVTLAQTHTNTRIPQWNETGGRAVIQLVWFFSRFPASSKQDPRASLLRGTYTGSSQRPSSGSRKYTAPPPFRVTALLVRVRALSVYRPSTSQHPPSMERGFVYTEQPPRKDPHLFKFVASFHISPAQNQSLAEVATPNRCKHSRI